MLENGVRVRELKGVLSRQPPLCVTAKLCQGENAMYKTGALDVIYILCIGIGIV